MSKKVKGVTFDSSSYGSYDDVKARIKHQGLLHDYQDLQKEAEATRNKFETMKQRKMTLLAEVRFLRGRCKYLQKNKPLKLPHVEEPVKSAYIEPYQQKSKKKDRSHTEKGSPLQNIPPIFNLNQKSRVYMEKVAQVPNIASVLNLNQNNSSRSVKETASKKSAPASNHNYRGKAHRGKEVDHQTLMAVIDSNRKEWTNSSTALRKSTPTFDLGPKDNSLSRKEAAAGTRAPVFYLNQISLEEEECLENYEPYQFEEERKASVIRGGLEEQQHNDMMLSVCRNIGDASTSRSGKRKISWQDPVALRV